MAVDALFAQVARYFSFVAWFFRDAFLRYRLRLVLIVFGNVAGVGLQALAVVVAYRYASAVESGKLLELAGKMVDPRLSFGLLVSAAAAVFLLAVTSAILVMRARVEGARVALDYAEYCSQRIYFLVSRLSTLPQAAPGNDYTMERFLELTRRDARYCGQVMRIASYGLLHVGTAVVAGVALCVINLRLSMFVFVILAVAALYLRRTSIRGAAHRARLQRHVADMFKDRRALEDRVLRNPAPLSPSDVLLRQAISQGGAAKMRSAILGQREVLEAGKLIAQIAMGGALFVVLIVQGGETLKQGSNWSALVVYIAALSFFGASMSKVGRMLVNMNRFYPPLGQHARFVQQANPEVAQGSDPQLGVFWLEAEFLGGANHPRLELRTGDRLALVQPADVTRYSTFLFAKRLRPAGSDAAKANVPLPWFAGYAVAVPGGTLRENLGLPEHCSLDDLRAALASVQAEEGFIKLPESLERPLTTSEAQAISGPAMFVLMILSGLLNRRPLLVLEHAGLANVPGPMQEILLQRTLECTLIIAFRANRIDDVGANGESAAIIAGRNDLYGWTSMALFRAKNQAVMAAVAKAAADSSDGRLAAFDEDDIEEMA